MALITDESLLIYLQVDETDPAPYPTTEFLVAIFDAPDATRIAEYVANMEIWKDKKKLDRFFSKKPTINVHEPLAVCKAAAYLQDDGKVLTVKNVGAEQGLGPTLYAVVMELARVRKRKGVRPCDESGKILEKPKLIWQGFHTRPEYQGKVLTEPVPGCHPEHWLNMVYSLESSSMLLDYKHKRDKWKIYEKFWKDANGFRSWRDFAFDMAKLSVEAHVSGSNQ